MSKLKTFSTDVAFEVGNVVKFDWLGDKHFGEIERVRINEKEYPIYYVRSAHTKRVYNVGGEPGVTTGYIVEAVTELPKIKRTPKKVKTIVKHTDEITSELKQAVQQQKNFINHFFEIE